jgi:hypothetical protein
MFYLRYLGAELLRRFGKTLTISLGLAMASSVIIVIISVSQSLSTAQDKVLNPLQNVGTDIMVTRSVDSTSMASLDETTRNELMQDNTIGLNLADLGDPGEAFSTDTFLPGSLMTFDQSEINNLDKSLVANAASGLIMDVMHQEGAVPDVVAEFKTGGETIEINEAVPPQSGQELSKQAEAFTKILDELAAKGIDPKSAEGQKYISDAIGKSAPREFHGSIITPERTYTQSVGPIETNISSNSLTVAGVDTSKTDIGLILPDQVTSGTWFNSADQIIANKSYTDKQNYALGGTINLGGKDWILVGIVEPKLYTNTADLYLPLTDLQTLAERDGKINIMLIKSTNAQSVEDTSQQLEGAFAGAVVTNSKDTAQEVSGSLVNAANLTNKFIGVTSVIVISAAFVIVSLLTILSVNKRIREIGTLKAIGWSNTKIIRQIIAENVVLGVIGAVFGLGLAVGAIALLNHFDISLSATIASASQNQSFGFARRLFQGASATNAAVSTEIPLKIAYSYLVLLLGSLVAVIGSIFAGTLAAIKASKMKPQEALRNIE